MQKIIIIIIALILPLLGCTRFDREPTPKGEKWMGMINKDQFKARAYRKQYFDHTPAPKNSALARYNNDDESYERGFQDGCQTATSVIGTGFARTRGPKIDAEELSANAWYLRGYQDASTYCTLTLDWETH